MSPERGAAGPVSGRGFGRWIWQNVVPGVVISVVMLAAMAAAAEIYLRSTRPADETIWPSFYDGVTGWRFRPGAEIYTTNHLDFWTRSRANSLGFLDREPVPPAARPGSCHLVYVGDSLVEAHQVRIDQKAQVLLEQFAEKRLPALKLTAAAFGASDTGQLNQTAIYDHFVRAQQPKIVVLMFAKNDFSDNSAVIQGINHGIDPQHLPRVYARRNPDGTMTMQALDPDYDKHRLPALKGAAAPEPNAVAQWLRQKSRVYTWLDEQWWRVQIFLERKLYGRAAVAHGSNRIAQNARRLAQWPQYAYVLGDWNPDAQPSIDEIYFEDKIPAVFREALAFTGFAIDQFADRARRDGFRLIIMASSTMKHEDGADAQYRLLAQMGEQRGIPVIDLAAFIESKGGRPSEARFFYDGHYSPKGHEWVAEATLDYLGKHPEVCR